MLRSPRHLLPGAAVTLSVLIGAGGPTNAHARPLEIAPLRAEGAPAEVQARGVPAYLDTLWFGGTGPDGLGIQGGVWDFEDGTVQGWTSIDFTNTPVYVRRVEQSDFAGEPAIANINGGSLWFGAFTDETLEGCWPGGFGYSNTWNVTATKTFTYEGDQGIEISFQYFVDSEEGFDFTYLILDSSAGTDTLNTSMIPDLDGFGYSGSTQFGNNIGTPAAPALEHIVVPHEEMPPTGESYTLQFRFVSEWLYSDGLDSFSGFLDSENGPFGVDEVFVETPRTGLPSLFDISTFDIFSDGWVAAVEPPNGSLMTVVPIGSLDPQPAPGCPLSDPGNDFALIAADQVDVPHPEPQREMLLSPPIYVGPGSGLEAQVGFFVESAAFAEDLFSPDNGSYRTALHYYPWTCPETGAVRWSVEPADAGNGGFSGGSFCETRSELIDASLLPGQVDSIRVAVEVISCVEYENCAGNDTPALDDVRIGVIHLTGPIRVPEHFATVAEAIEAAVDGATILVGPGIYTGGIDTMGKAITIISTDGPLATIIDADGLGRAATFDDGEGADTVLEGFTLTGGVAPMSTGRGLRPPPSLAPARAARGGQALGGGVACLESSPTIRRCRIVGNVGDEVSGVYIREASPILEDCEFVGNVPSMFGAVGIEGSECQPVFTRCVIAGNQGEFVGALTVLNGAFVQLLECTVTDNHALEQSVTGGMYVGGGAEVEIQRSILWGNCGSFDEGFIDVGCTVEIGCSDVRFAGLEILGIGIDAGDNFDADPLFCQSVGCMAAPTSEGLYGLDDGSPCLAENSPCGQRVGALESCSAVDVADASPITPTRVALHAAVPNPFNPTTRIRYDVAHAGATSLRIFDVTGQLVRTLVEGVGSAGQQLAIWDGRTDGGRPASSGVYFYRLETGGVSRTRQMTLLK